MAKTVRQALKGRGDFISDIYARDMLYGATIRSPYARALIRNIHRDELPEDVVCITAADIPGENALRVADETAPLLASDECTYAGEPVAILAGPSQREVVNAMAGVEIEYDELQPAYSYTHPPESHVVSRRTFSRGDAERAVAACSSRVEGTYRTGIQEHLYNEPQGAVAFPERGHMIVRTATQWPFHVRATVAGALGIPASRCVVRPADPGIALDGKLWYPSLVSAHAALLARRTGRVVKLVYSNIEDFRFSPKRAPFSISSLTGVDEHGRLCGAEIEITYNAGSHALFTREISERVAASTFSSYTCADLTVTVTAVRTNLPPLNVLCGFGSASAFFATESHAARIAEVAHTDPLAWRIANLRDAGDPSAAPLRSGRGTGAGQADTGRARITLEAIAEQSDFARKFAAYELQKKRREEADLKHRNHGIGLALGAQSSGFLSSTDGRPAGSVIVRLETDGSAVLRTSAVPGSRAVLASWRNRIATILGLTVSDVVVENTDTSLTPDSGPSTLSRNVAVISHLVEQACNAIQKRRFRSPLPIEVRRSSRTSRSGDQPGEPGRHLSRSSHGAAVVEVGVDPVTFETSVTDVWLAVDGGRILDENEARRSLEMSVYQALEWATHEIVVYRDGAIDPRSYLAYRNISEPVLPQIHISLVDSPEKAPQGIGELPQNCIPAALAAAVSQATGRYMDQLPTNPVLIHDYLEASDVEVS